MILNQKIYLKLGKPPETITELLLAFFSAKLKMHALNTTTYFDETCKRVQCYASRLRSFDDIFDCVNTYFPDTPPEVVFKELLLLDVRDSVGTPLWPLLYHCSTIQRVRMCYHTTKVCTIELSDVKKFNSKWSWSELALMLGLKNRKEVGEYIINNKKTNADGLQQDKTQETSEKVNS